MDSLWAGSLFEERVENKPGGELGSEYESVSEESYEEERGEEGEKNKPGGELGSEYESVSEESYEEEWGEEGEKTVLLIIDS